MELGVLRYQLELLQSLPKNMGTGPQGPQFLIFLLFILGKKI